MAYLYVIIIYLSFLTIKTKIWQFTEYKLLQTNNKAKLSNVIIYIYIFFKN